MEKDEEKPEIVIENQEAAYWIKVEKEVDSVIKGLNDQIKFNQAVKTMVENKIKEAREE